MKLCSSLLQSLRQKRWNAGSTLCFWVIINIAFASFAAADNVAVDSAGQNSGTLENGLKFGGNEIVGPAVRDSLSVGPTREGIASNRTYNGNAFGLDFYTANINRMSITSSGNVGVGVLLPKHKLEVNGDASVTVLQITGGSDVAEPFQVASGTVAKGSVLVIDPMRPGQLKESNRSYDSRVAGIVSGAGGIEPGISLRSSNLNGTQNVALSGRVYALAEARHAPIHPGDLLTTSDLPGHCMKMRDWKRGHGAVLGKAMTSLDRGDGMVLVLVSLQ